MADSATRAVDNESPNIADSSSGSLEQISDECSPVSHDDCKTELSITGHQITRLPDPSIGIHHTDTIMMENEDNSIDSCDEQSNDVYNETDSSSHRERNAYLNLNRTVEEQRHGVTVDMNNTESDLLMTTQRNLATNGTLELPVSYQHEITDQTSTENTVLEEQRQGTDSVSLRSDYSCPPPDYEDFVVMEYYRMKGLVSCDAQTEPVSCLCMCHNDPYRNTQELPRNYGGEFSGNVGYTPFVCPQQALPYGFRNVDSFQRVDQNMGNPAGQVFVNNVHVHGMQAYDPASNVRCTETSVVPVQQDRIVKPCFWSLIILIVVGGIIFAIVAVT